MHLYKVLNGLLFLLAAVICNVLLLLILKGFRQFGIVALQGIVVNYFVAGLCGLVPFLNRMDSLPDDFRWLFVSLSLGVLFISIFYLISQTTEQIGVGVASVANKMSLVIPALAAVYFYNEHLGWLKIVAIILAIISVLFTVYKAEGGRLNTRIIVLPLLVFFGSGLIDLLVNLAQKIYISDISQTYGFIALAFLGSGFIGTLVLIYYYFVKRESFQLRSIPGGILLGIPNFFSIYFVMKAIESDILQSSVLYPVVNLGVVLLTTVFGILFFKERLSGLNWLGLVLSIISILVFISA